jgi:hypothetical protein
MFEAEEHAHGEEEPVQGHVLSIVREVFNLRLRNEVFDPLPKHQTAG